MKKITIAAALAVFVLMAGCGTADSETAAGYQRITAGQAREMMNGDDPFILLDVRTYGEFAERRIEGAVLIPSDEIRGRAAAELPGKDAVILVYCRSGARSEQAARQLLELGYTNVFDFGGINDWPYETVGGA